VRAAAAVADLVPSAEMLLGMRPGAHAAAAAKAAALKVAMGKASKEESELADANHKFWSTQPVPRLAAEVTAAAAIGPIEAPRTIADVRAEPLVLPSGFEWTVIDVLNDKDMRETFDVSVQACGARMRCGWDHGHARAHSSDSASCCPSPFFSSPSLSESVFLFSRSLPPSLSLSLSPAPLL